MRDDRDTVIPFIGHRGYQKSVSRSVFLTLHRGPSGFGGQTQAGGGGGGWWWRRVVVRFTDSHSAAPRVAVQGLSLSLSVTAG